MKRMTAVLAFLVLLVPAAVWAQGAPIQAGTPAPGAGVKTPTVAPAPAALTPTDAEEKDLTIAQLKAQLAKQIANNTQQTYLDQYAAYLRVRDDLMALAEKIKAAHGWAATVQMNPDTLAFTDTAAAPAKQ
jgi:hypothetical protein